MRKGVERCGPRERMVASTVNSKSEKNDLYVMMRHGETIHVERISPDLSRCGWIQLTT